VLQNSLSGVAELDGKEFHALVASLEDLPTTDAERLQPVHGVATLAVRILGLPLNVRASQRGLP
jgi:hypothetical protein